jgi:hypothetical protein
MTDHPIRPFANDAAVRSVGEGLLARTLPKAEWTHEAHLAACLWLVRERPDFTPESELPDTIRTYNVAVGGENTDSAGYHETLTQLYIRGVRAFAASLPEGTALERNEIWLNPGGFPKANCSDSSDVAGLEAGKGWHDHIRWICGRAW